VTTGPQINRAADARKPDQLIVNLNRADVRPWKQVFVGGSGTMRTIKVHPLDGTVVGGSDVSGPFYYDAKIAVPKDATVPTYGMPDQPWTMRPVGWRATLDHFGRDNEGLIHTDQLAFDPTNADKLFYVGGQEWRPGRGVLVTHDRGKSWWFSPLLRPDGKAVFITNASSSERLKVNPQNPQTVYYGSRRDGLYRSVNGGANWSAVEHFPDAQTTFSDYGSNWIQFATINGKPTTIVSAHPSNKDSKFTPGVFTSTDNGATWTRTDWPTGNIGVVDPAGTFLYVSSKKLMKVELATGKSTEITPMELGGKNPGWDYSPVAVSPENPDWIVVFTREYGQGRFFRSKDGGATWTQFHNDDWKGNNPRIVYEAPPYYPSLGGGAHPFAGVWDVTFDTKKPSRLWIAYWPGSLMCEDAWADKPVFRNMGEGHEEVCLFDLISPSKGAPLISGMMDVGGFVHHRLDVPPAQGLVGVAPEGPHGQKTPLEVTSLDFSEADPNLIVSGACWRYTPPPDGNGTGHARYSLDGGASWQKFATQPVPLAKDGRIAVAAGESKTVVWMPRLDKEIGVYFTRDFGATWTKSVGAPRGLVWPDMVFSFYKPLASDRVIDNQFYIYNKTDGRFFRSSDGGANFAHVSTLPSQGEAHTVYHRVQAVPGKGGEVWCALDDKGLFRSTNGGDSFTQLFGVEQAVDISFGAPMPGTSSAAVYIVGRIKGETDPALSVYRSVDNGQSWTRIDGPDLGWASVVAIAADRQVPGRVFVGTNGRGIYFSE
jgi:photosystem II stability/assembly factor-like uncharacterized protein